MKPQKISISVFVMAITMCSTSCGPKGWFLESTCQRYLYVANNSSKDVTIRYDRDTSNGGWGQIRYFVVKQGVTKRIMYGCNKPTDDSRPSILLCEIHEDNRERYCFVVDEKIVREWHKFDIGKGIPHHFYDDESWVLDKYQTGDNNYYTYYEWTYTITDEDITPEQR